MYFLFSAVFLLLSRETAEKQQKNRSAKAALKQF